MKNIRCGKISFVIMSFLLVLYIPLLSQSNRHLVRDVLQTAEVMPQFPGGNSALFNFIAENTNYPASAQQLGIEGTIYVGFIVEPDGSISDITIKRGLPEGGAGLEAEALRVASLMPHWIPGFQDGNSVRVSYTLPFKFKLGKQRNPKF